jgi:integrase
LRNVLPSDPISKPDGLDVNGVSGPRPQARTQKPRTKRPRGQMLPFTREDVATIRAKLSAKGRTRDLALFETAISTLLRSSDVVALRVADVISPSAHKFYGGGEATTVETTAIADEASVPQKKTGKIATVPLTASAKAALAQHIALHRLTDDAYLFTNASNSGCGKPLSTTAFRQLVKRWSDLAGYRDTSRFSGHSLRRTRASIIYRETRNVVACSHLLGHSSIAHTEAYLGVGRDEAIALSRQFEI